MAKQKPSNTAEAADKPQQEQPGPSDPISEQMAEASAIVPEEGVEATTASVEDSGNPTIRELCYHLRDRIEAVMGSYGIRPGDLEAFSADLATMATTEHPLMDCRD